jgi:hypothetical protein
MVISLRRSMPKGYVVRAPYAIPEKGSADALTPNDP